MCVASRTEEFSKFPAGLDLTEQGTEADWQKAGDFSQQLTVGCMREQCERLRESVIHGVVPVLPD